MIRTYRVPSFMHIDALLLRRAGSATLFALSLFASFLSGCAPSSAGEDLLGAPSDVDGPVSPGTPATPGGDVDAGAETPGTAPQPPPDGPDAASPDPVDVDAGTHEDAGAPPGAGACAVDEPCSSAHALGVMSGDTGSSVLGFAGTRSQWLSVFLTEDNRGGLPSAPMKVKVALTSPPGVNFDLFVYLAGNPDKTTLECAKVAKSSTETSDDDQVSLEFGETGAFSNGAIDDRNVTIEVRHVSGECAPSAHWALTVTGNAR